MIKLFQDMKKIPLFLIACSFALAGFSPIIANQPFLNNQIENVSKADGFSGIDNINSLNMTTNYKLTSNVVVSSFDGLGSQASPYTGTFDGNHKTVTINSFSKNSHQGLFAFTDGATIKNLKVRINVFNLDSTDLTEFVLGGIVANAKNTTFENCEVEFFGGIPTGESLIIDIPIRTTMGGIAGIIEGCDLKNCLSDFDFYSTFKSSSVDTNINLGGLVGEVRQNSSIIQSASFGNVTTSQSAEFSTNNFIGGIAGVISGSSIEIKNCVSAGDLSFTKVNDEGEYNIGSVFGGILTSNLIAGSLSNIAYIQDYKSCGLNDNKYETYGTQITKLPTSFATDESFYTNFETSFKDENTIDQIFSWFERGEWDFENIWLFAAEVSKKQLRLQSFQNFNIAFSSMVDSSGLLEIEGANPQPASYGQIVNLTAEFKEPEKSKYYTLAGIKKGSEDVDFEFLENGGTSSKDVTCKETDDGFDITIKASSLTEGVYSIVLESIKYEGKLFTAEQKGDHVDYSVNPPGCKVVFENTEISEFSSFTENLDNMKVSAQSGTKYKLHSWRLLYPQEDGETTINEEKYTDKGQLYLNEGFYTNSSMELDFAGEQKTYIKDGDIEKTYLDQDFVLVAVFESDPYDISFDVETSNKGFLKSITVDNISDDDGLIDFSDDASASVGKNDNVVVSITLDVEYTINQAKLINSIIGENNPNEQTFKINFEEEVKNDLRVVKVEFKTSKLKNENNGKFNFVVETVEAGYNDSTLPLGWIIGGSVGGAVLLGGIAGLTVFLMKRRKFSSGSARSKRPSETQDYKNYF